MAGIRRILGSEQEELVARVRGGLSDLQAALARFHAASQDEETLRTSLRQLDELFLLVVVGEFNAGKSAFINALIGSPVLEEGVTPTTTRIQILKYGSQAGRAAEKGDLDVITAPVDVLRDINIVDTPGTNAIERRHEAITQEFVPRADLILFVTSADRPFTESEHAFLERIREWGKKVVIVVNKIDILEGEEDTARIQSFIAENVRKLLGFTPEIFPVAARLALHSKQSENREGWERSRFESLEKYILSTLDEEERLRLKLLNPIGVGLRLAGKYAEVADARLELLKEDLSAIEEIESELEVYKEDMKRGFRFRLSDVDNVLHEFENRGDEFFEDVIRITRVFELMNKAKIKADFEKRVIRDAPKLIEQRVEDIIDWLVASDLQQWQSVRDHLARRQSEHTARVVERMSGGFDYDRARLLETVGRSAQRTLEEYDHAAEAGRMAESVQAAVANTALLEVGAVGLGTAVSLVASSTAADVTGILAAGALATIGFFVIPHRRRAARAELRRKIAALREQLMGALNSQFEREIARSLRRLHEAMAPYTRFVRAETESFTQKREELLRIREGLTGLRGRIES